MDLDQLTYHFINISQMPVKLSDKTANQALSADPTFLQSDKFMMPTVTDPGQPVQFKNAKRMSFYGT
jgi:hypothetical protein